MTAIDAMNLVNTDGAQLLRPRKGEPGQYDAKPMFTGSKKGWMLVDSFTASAVLQVFNAIGPENQEKMKKLPLLKMVDISWKLVKKFSR